MKLVEFIQIIIRNIKWVIFFPVLVSAAVFVLTRNAPRTYTSEMVIYTGIASGYNLDNDIKGSIDYHQANSKFDNLINTITSKEARKEVALRLMAELIHEPLELKRLELTSAEWLRNPDTMHSIKGRNREETFNRLFAQLHSGNSEQLHLTVFGQKQNPFNVRTLAGISATRLGFSDMVKVSYTAEDAVLAKRTLDILAEVFMKKYQGMRIGEVSSVVKYFQDETASALVRLQQTESLLRDFRSRNQVINYYEQTKYIADQKEDYEQRESKLEMQLTGVESALRKLESKMKAAELRKLKSEEVVALRDELATKYNRKGLLDASGRSDEPGDAEIRELRSRLTGSISELHRFNNTVEGIPGEDILDEWLQLTITKEQAGSELDVLRAYKMDFSKVFDRFAPLGSDLNKLERDVDVAEKEYLNLLHNLNQAKLRERNLSVTENISITDTPNLPIVANPSKRLILVIAAFMSVLILVLTIIILREFLDVRVNTPAKLFEQTGLKAASAFVRQDEKNKVLTGDINLLSSDRLALRMIDAVKDQPGTDRNPGVLIAPLTKTSAENLQLLSSSQATIGSYLTERCSLRSTSTQLLNRPIFISDQTERELLGQELIGSSGMILLFISASEKIDDLKREKIEGWKKYGVPVEAILWDTEVHHIEQFIGDVPKHRSNLRKFIKNSIKRYSK